MAKGSTKQPFRDDPDNTEFTQLIEQLAGFGLTQYEVADALGISASQVSRIKRCERHAPKRHVRVLRRQLSQVMNERNNEGQSLKPRVEGPSIFAIEHAALGRLSAKSAVEAFRDLLWARAAERRIPTTRVSISSEIYTPDGGVDASILEGGGSRIEGDELLDSGTRFQIKTGEFAPWQPSQIKKELFGRKRNAFENLGSSIQEVLRHRKRFVLVCFGIDPTDRQIHDAKKALASAFATCGYPNAVVQVWGQTQLIGLFHRYPSLCLRLLGYENSGFRAWLPWSSDADMKPQFHHSPELECLIEDLRRKLLSGEKTHIRLLGEPGVGKTRLALEMTRAEILAPVTLYVQESQTLLHSSFINELTQIDDHRFVVLVIDECRPKDRAEIWNRLKSRSERIRLITIDHGPDDSTDELMETVHVRPAEFEQILAILRDHDLGANDARRWAHFCDGCPRVAHVVGDNLRRNSPSLLQPLAMSEVWDRFVVGHDDPNSEEVELRKIVLRHVALFVRFGFGKSVEREAKFIAELAARCDPRLTWRRFQSIIASLRRRRVLQGVTTLYVTPRLLHVHLLHEFWELYGGDVDIAEMLKTMPQGLWRWFIDMLRYVHDVKRAEDAVEDILSDRGLFPTDKFPDDEGKGYIVNALAETSPRATLRCLHRTVGSMDLKSLRNLVIARQWIVRTLEKLAVWEDCFDRAAELLLSLAEAETETHVNSATGTFKQLFNLSGMAPTEVKPSHRLAVLEGALESNSAARRWLGLEACAAACSTHGGMRVVGPEHQGLRRTIQFWIPKTYEELCDAYAGVWHLLSSRLETWEGEDRRRLIGKLIDASKTLLHVDRLSEAVLQILEIIATDPATDVKSLAELLQSKLRHERQRLSPVVIKEMEKICDKIDGHDFPSRLRRFVKHATWEDLYGGRDGGRQLLEERLEELAENAMCNPDLLLGELSWLVCEDSSSAHSFASLLSKKDLERQWLGDILRFQRSHPETASPVFLSGYLSGIFDRDCGEWETIMLELAEDPSVAPHYSDFVIRSGMSDKVAKRVVEYCRKGIQDTRLLVAWWFSGHLGELSLETVSELLELQVETGSGELWNNAVRMCHTFFLERQRRVKQLPEVLMLRLLTDDAMTKGRVTDSASYYWSRLARQFLDCYPERKRDFLRRILNVGTTEVFVLLDLNTNDARVLTKLLEEDPIRGWDCIGDVYREASNEQRRALQLWLAEGGHSLGDAKYGGPIQYVPANHLFDWVDENVEERGLWVAGMLPKTLDKTVAGQLTRDFVARFGRKERIASELTAHFHSRMWWGSDSDHYRGLRNEAGEWLTDEKNATVRRWVEEYVEELSYLIRRAEIQEERQF